MKFRFITILHYLKLDTIKKRGVKIYPGARISNGSQILSKTLETELMRTTLGDHSITEFINSVYFYIDGAFNHIHSKKDMDEIGDEHALLYLRHAQAFARKLWEIKDNNVYVRDGFFIFYHNHFNEGFTYKASLAEIFTCATGEKKNSLFTGSEISSAINNFEPPKIEDFEGERSESKWSGSKHLSKAFGSNRMVRAHYFIESARKSHVVSIKIVFYCHALECLFTVENSEVHPEIAERVSILLSSSKESKMKLFQLIKSAYSHRSRLLHGQYLKETESTLIEISNELDNVLRQLILYNHEIFS